MADRPSPASAAPEPALARRNFLTRTASLNPYIGEIALVAFSFPPQGWALCNGQLLPVAQNQALFNLLGSTYGGDGVLTFALPDLRGRAPIHQGQGAGLASRILGEIGGAENVTLTSAQLPAHAHPGGASTGNGTSDSPVNGVPARNAAGTPTYGTTADGVQGAGAIGSTGGGQSHTNMPPFLIMNYIIALNGYYPSQS